MVCINCGSNVPLSHLLVKIKDDDKEFIKSLLELKNKNNVEIKEVLCPICQDVILSLNITLENGQCMKITLMDIIHEYLESY